MMLFLLSLDQISAEEYPLLCLDGNKILDFRAVGLSSSRLIFCSNTD